MLANIDLLIAVLLAIVLGMLSGYMLSSYERSVKRVVSPLFRISVILLVAVLGFSGGSSITRYEYTSTPYIFLSIIAALLSGFLSVAFSALLERISGAPLDTQTNTSSSVSKPLFPIIVLIAFIASTSLGAIAGLAVDKQYISLVSNILLIVLIYSVCVELGTDREYVKRSIYMAPKYWYIWVGTIIGSLVSGMAIQYIFGIRFSISSSLAMGWYSYIAGYAYTAYGEEASLYSFLQNYFREALTYIVIPVLSRITRSASLIAYGGVTTMDNTLPVYISYLGKEYSFIAISNGVILTILAPIVVQTTDLILRNI
ncbi:MAG: lysine exporter LysO family protein [Sulfolobales archaeon]